MGKNKTTRRSGSGSIASPRGKQGVPTHPEQPVTDTVMGVIARRIRTARKKLTKVAEIDKLVSAGKTLNEDQDRVYQTKGPLTAVIDELVKLEPLVEAAFANELSEQLTKVKKEWSKDSAAAQPEASQPVVEVSPEDEESEEIEEMTAEASIPVEESTGDAENKENSTQTLPPIDDDSIDNIIETLYILEIFSQDRFDLSPFIGDHSRSLPGVISQEEAECLEEFGKSLFKKVSHVPKEVLENTKCWTRCLFSLEHAGTVELTRITNKLRSSEVMERELKLTVHGFPLPIDKEVSDTMTESTDKSGEKSKQENPPVVESAPQLQESSPQIEETQTAEVLGVVTGASLYVHPIEAIPVPDSKDPRPFLPFPPVGMAGGPAMNFAMTQPTQMIDMHMYHPAQATTEPPYVQHSATQPVREDSALLTSTSTHQPAAEDPPPERVSAATAAFQLTSKEQPQIDPEPNTTPKEESTGPEKKTETNPDAQERGPAPQEGNNGEQGDSLRDDVEGENDKAGESSGPMPPSETQPPVQQRHRGGQYQGRHHGDHRPWQPRGGVYRGRGGNFRGGRGGPRGRSGYSYGSRRPQFDQQRPPYKHTSFGYPSGRDRHSYGPRPRRGSNGGGGGYDRGQQ